jgi:valyl-tRNA synthetase
MPEGIQLVSVTTAGVDFHLPVDSLVDKAKQLDRIEKEIAKLELELAKIAGRLNNPQFVERAKPEVIERDRAAVEEMTDRLAKLQERKSLFN